MICYRPVFIKWKRGREERFYSAVFCCQESARLRMLDEFGSGRGDTCHVVKLDISVERIREINSYYPGVVTGFEEAA